MIFFSFLAAAFCIFSTLSFSITGRSPGAPIGGRPPPIPGPIPPSIGGRPPPIPKPPPIEGRWPLPLSVMVAKCSCCSFRFSLYSLSYCLSVNCSSSFIRSVILRATFFGEGTSRGNCFFSCSCACVQTSPHNRHTANNHNLPVLFILRHFFITMQM